MVKAEAPVKGPVAAPTTPVQGVNPGSAVNETPSLRVLHVCARLKEGGITTFVKSIIDLNNACDTRHDLLLTHPEEGGVSAGQTYRLNVEQQSAWSTMARLVHLCKPYDAVMVHAAHPVVVLSLLVLRKKVFLFQHGMSVSSGPWLKRSFKKVWYTLLPPLLRAQVVCSTPFAFQKSRSLGIWISKRRAVLVPFGTSLFPLPKRARKDPAGDGLRVGMVGRLVQQKRHEIVLRSLASYRGRTTILVKIAGEGPELERLKQLGEQLSPSHARVDFCGHVDNMDAFYEDLDLVVFPSEGESFGLVALEALVRTIPVVVFPDVGGCLSIIEDGANGFVVQGGAAGLTALWHTLDTDRGILARQQQYIAAMDFTPYDIASTRASLDRLV